MITGLKLQITTGQLRDHLLEGIAFHVSRRDFYQGKAAEMEAAGEIPQNVTNDPVKGMKDRAGHHADRVYAFQTWDKYLIPDEVYVLDNSDLSRLEMAYL